MNEKIFVDTWGWLVIHNKREPKHAVVSSHGSGSDQTNRLKRQKKQQFRC